MLCYFRLGVFIMKNYLLIGSVFIALLWAFGENPLVANNIALHKTLISVSGQNSQNILDGDSNTTAQLSGAIIDLGGQKYLQEIIVYQKAPPRSIETPVKLKN
mgnify:CR=1 FL=1